MVRTRHPSFFFPTDLVTLLWSKGSPWFQLEKPMEPVGDRGAGASFNLSESQREDKKRLCTECLCCPPNPYTEALNTSVMAFGGGAFGKYLGLDAVMGMGPHGGISTLLRSSRECRAPPCQLPVHSPGKGHVRTQ